MPITVDMNGVDVKVQQLQNADGLKRGLRAARLYLGGKLGYYPPVSRRPQAQYWTAKQRRGFFAALNAGDIEVPYRRGLSPSSERMRERWTQSASADNLTHTIGNNSSYVNLVMGERQAQYHKQTGWKKASDIVKDERNEVERIIAAEVARDVRS